jgi:hypothetical protein
VPRTASFLAAVLACVVAATVAPDASQAIPRYSARYRQNCNLCHHNPTGGGMRSLYASQYIVPTEMALRRIRSEALDSIRPDITESITIGTDVRTIHHWADTERNPPELNFFQMQGDLYVRFQADERLSAYLDRGQRETLEIFGLAYVLPWNGFVKFGRFTPAFGWKFADHRQFVREGRTGDRPLQDLSFEPPAHTDVGIEAGIYPGDFSLVASALNGEPGSSADGDDDLGFMVRGAYRFRLGAAGFALGATGYRNTRLGMRRSAGGPFWYVSVGRFIWLGETDWSKVDASSTSRTALITSHELSWQLMPGLDVRAVYNYADPDIDHDTGSRIKAGGGVDALATPFFGVKAMVNVYQDHKGSAGEPAIHVSEDLRYTQTEVTLHLFY